MKIGFDISMLVYSGSGVATYTYNLVKNLLLIDKSNQYHLFYSSFRRPKNFYYLDKLEKLGAYVHTARLTPSLLQLLWGKYHFLPIEWFTGKMDIFHTSDFLRPPLLAGTIGVTTVHDLTWRLFPRWHTPQIVAAHRRKISKTLKYGDIVIFSSKNTQSDFLRLYPHAQALSHFVSYLGVDSNFRPLQNPKSFVQVVARYHLKPPYLVYIGAIEPRKNLSRLIRAYSQLIKLPKYHNLNLVIGGRAGWKNQSMFKLVHTLGLGKRVNFTGFIEDSHLPVVYGLAQCSAYVSLYEGFGLPPLEAQACGCPVVASKVASIPEVLGDSAIMVDPTRVSSILKGLVRCLNNRDHLITVGLANSRRFTWKKTAEDFLKIIEFAYATKTKH